MVEFDRGRGGVSAYIHELERKRMAKQPQPNKALEDATKAHAKTMDELGPVSPDAGSDQLVEDERAATQGGKIQMFDFDKLYREDNVREPEDVQLDDMIAAFKESGYFKQQHPLVISLKDDGKGLVLQGNRRTEALEVIRKDDPDLWDQLVPDGKVPCLIYKGLDTTQEALIRNDHSSREDRVGLGDASLFRAVRQLLQAGYTSQAGIAQKLGLFVTKDGKQEPNRSYVQKRVELAKMPQYVQEEFLKFWRDGKDATPVRLSDVNKLRKAQNDDYNNGHVGAEGGPEFKKVWDIIMERDQDESTSGSQPRAMSRTDLETTAKTRKSNILREALSRAAGNTKVRNFDKLDEEVGRMEEAHKQLDLIAKHCKEATGMTFKELISKIQEILSPPPPKKTTKKATAKS